jgi:hypothetical protein
VESWFFPGSVEEPASPKALYDNTPPFRRTSLSYTRNMRIDHGLCQKILVAVENDPEAGTGQFLKIPLFNNDPSTIAHHVKYLWDAKLITGQDVGHLTSPYPEIAVQDLTPAGHRHLAESRMRREIP